MNQNNSKGNKKITFIIPAPTAFHSGGNLYNAALIAALRKENVGIQQIELTESTPFAKASDIFFWDTLYFDQLDSLDTNNENWLIIHHLESLYPPKGWSAAEYFEQKEREILEKFDGFLVSSLFTEKYLRNNGFDDKSIMVIPPALLSKPTIIHRRYKSIHAIMVANLQERKGILPFLQALVDKKEKPSFKLSIIGNANMESAYAQQCLDLIKQHPFLQKCIHFKGVLSHDDVLEMYSQTNLYLSTAFMETFGMSIQEAAASGMPLLVYDGGNAGFHVKNGQNGTVFKNIESLVDGLFSLIENKMNCIEIGKGAYGLAKEDTYDWTAAAQLFLSKIT